MLKQIVLMITLTLMLSCVPAFAEQEIWVALMDLSGSMGQGKGTPLAINIGEFERLIGGAAKNTTIIVLGFGRKADVQLLKVVMPSQSGPQNRNILATLDAAVKKLRENLATKTGEMDRSRTDIVGALYRAARIFSDYPSATGKKRLLMLSDMLDNETLGITLNKLKTKGSHRNLVAKVEREGEYPDLKGVQVSCFGSVADQKGITAVQTEIAISELKRFWEWYFGKTGGVLRKYTTTMY